MIVSNQPDIVTLVARPPGDASGSLCNAFIDDVRRTLASRKAIGNWIVEVATVRDADLALSKITSELKGQLRLQIVGHSISGMLSLGASWLPDDQIAARAFRYPYYVLDTNPAALGLLAKYAGRISELMLVGCNIGGASSFGYAINGRTLTYTLAELLRCLVRGADDVVAPDEFDAHGWYTPSPHHRRPKGWRWTEASPPVWVDPGVDPVARGRTNLEEVFEVRAITRSLLPVPDAVQPLDLSAANYLTLTCSHTASEEPRSALPELTLDTDRGPAELLCGGRFLRWQDTYYVVERNPRLSSALTALLWGSDLARVTGDIASATSGPERTRTSVAG